MLGWREAPVVLTPAPTGEFQGSLHWTPGAGSQAVQFAGVAPGRS